MKSFCFLALALAACVVFSLPANTGLETVTASEAATLLGGAPECEGVVSTTVCDHADCGKQGQNGYVKNPQSTATRIFNTNTFKCDGWWGDCGLRYKSVQSGSCNLLPIPVAVEDVEIGHL